MILPLLLIFGGGAALLALTLRHDDEFGPVPDHKPDMPPSASGPINLPTTRYRKIDAILPQLKQASDASGIPLGLMVGWLAKESGGRLEEVTKLDERGVFQLHPDESKALGLDHQRLSTDMTYSIAGGVALIRKYMGIAQALNVAAPGSDYFWRLVKLLHTMGSGATRTIVKAAEAAGQAGSWRSLEDYALSNEKQLLSATKHSPTKWFPLVDEVAQIGGRFGFGEGGTAVVGAMVATSDIVDPLDCLS